MAGKFPEFFRCLLICDICGMLNRQLSFILLQILLCFSIVSQAQILNVEKSRLESDSSNYFAGNVSVSASLYNRSAAASDPVNLLGFNLNSNVYYKSVKHQYNFITQIDYLRINENPFLNTGFFHFRAHFFTKEMLSMEAYTQYQYDNFRQLRPRNIVGLNARQKIFQNTGSTMYGGVGPMFESETWVHPFTDEQVQLSLVKLNSYLSYRAKLGESFDLNTVVYYQTGYDRNIGNFRNRINVMTNILARMTKRLSFTFSFNIQYEDRPVVPVTPLIYDIRNGIAVRF